MASPYYCDLSAFTEKQRLRHEGLAVLLRPQVAEFVELADGYKAIFNALLELELTAFRELELLCCPFFEISLSQENGLSSLMVTGGGDIKPFIRAEFGISEN